MLHTLLRELRQRYRTCPTNIVIIVLEQPENLRNGGSNGLSELGCTARQRHHTKPDMLHTLLREHCQRFRTPRTSTTLDVIEQVDNLRNGGLNGPS
jgi:hypothetical protein